MASVSATMVKAELEKMSRAGIGVVLRVSAARQRAMMLSAASSPSAVVCSPPVMPSGQTSSAALTSARRTMATPSASAAEASTASYRMPAAASEPSTAAGSSALYLPLAVTLPRTAPAARVSPESTVMVSREMLPLPSETMNSPAYRPSCSSGIPTSSADVLVAGGVDRRGVDRGLRRLDRGWPYLAADGGGLVLGGSGLEQGTTDLNDRRRLSDEPGGEN